MNNYSYYYKNIDHFIQFIDQANEFGRSSLFKTTAKIKQLVLSIWNLLFGDHRWYSYKKADQVIQHYVSSAGSSERTDDTTEKILILFDKLSLSAGQQGRENTGIQRKWIEKLQSRNTSSPDPELAADPADFGEELILKQKVVLPPEPDTVVDPTSMDYQLPVLDASKLPYVSSKLLFQIEADEFGKHSDLEGMPIEQPLHFVLSYIKERCAQGFPISKQEKEIIRELTIAHRIASATTFSRALREAITQAFKTQQPFLIPGGWTGIPSGHAMYYELIPEDEEKATLRIFNTGEGIQRHARFQVGVKEKVGYVEWKGIAKERLLDPLFAKSIEEMRSYAFLPVNPDVQTKYTFRLIYQGLREFLQVPIETQSFEENAFHASLIKPQLAGTCTYRSLLAFLKSKMDRGEFRRFKCDIRIQALAAHLLSPYATLASVREALLSQENEEQIAKVLGINYTSRKVRWRLIKKSLQQINRKVDRLYRDKLVGTIYLEQAESVLRPIVDWVNNQHTAIVKKRDAQKYFGYQHVQNQAHRGEIISPRTFGKTSAVESSQFACSHLLDRLQSIPLNNPVTIDQELEQMRLLLASAHSHKEYTAINHGVIECAKRLDINPQFWQTRCKSKQEIDTIIEDLNEISNLFFISCFRVSNPDKIFPEKLYAIYKLLYVQHILAGQAYPDIVSEISFKPGLSFQLHDRRIQGEFLKIDRAMVQPGCKPFLFDNLSSLELPSLEHNRCSNDKSTQLRELLEKEHPEILKKIIAKHPNYASMSPMGQYQIFCSSPDLPSWLRGVRDNALRIHFLRKSFIVPPEDEKASLKLLWPVNIIKNYFLFKIEESEPFFIKIEGIDQRSLNFLSEERRKLQKAASNGPFAFIHRMMSKKPMQQLFFDPIFGEIGEKELVAVKIKEFVPDMSEKSSKELVHIFTSPHLRAIEGLEYFIRYPEKISDPDYQQIFEMAFFGVTDFAASYDQDLAPRISAFLKQQLENAIGQNCYSAAAFLIRMNRYFSHDDCYKEYAFDGAACLRRLIMDIGVAPEVVSVLYAELAAHIGEMLVCSDQDLIDLLAARIRMIDCPILSDGLVPKTEWEVERAFQVHSKAMDQRIAPDGVPDQKFLQAVFQKAKGRESHAVWKILSKPGEAPRFSSSEGELYQPLEGRMSGINLELYLPSEIRENTTFRLSYPNQLKARMLSENVYQFQDKHGHTVTLTMENKIILIEQERFGKKYRLVAPHLFLETIDGQEISLFGSRYLVDRYHQLIPVNDPSKIVLIDPETDRAVYEVAMVRDQVEMALENLFSPSAWNSLFRNSPNTVFEQIIRISDGAILSKPSNMFLHIELPEYIQEWYDKERWYDNERHLVEIELPRFGLSFSPDPNDDTRLRCNQYPGWNVAQEQTFPSLGTCAYYLLLEDSKGNKKLILPDQKLAPPPLVKYESLEPRLERTQNKGEMASFRHFAYILDAEGQLHASSRAASLKLVEALAAHQQYELAARHLMRCGEKLSSYSEDECERLERICCILDITGEISGDQLAIALYAAYLLTTNPVNSKWGAETALPQLYKLYLVHFHDSTCLKLTKEQELRILKNILTKKYDPQLFVRLRELDADYASGLSKKESSKPEAPSLIGKGLKEILAKIKPPFPTSFLTAQEKSRALVTHAGDQIEKYIFEYLKQALEGSAKEKQWLRDASIYLRCDRSEETRALGFLIQEMLDDPGHFTAPPLRQFGMNSSEELDNWWKDQIAKVSQKQLPDVMGSETEIGDLTPPYFRLEKRGEPLLQIPFSFSTDPVPSLALTSQADQFFQLCTTEVTLTENIWLEKFLEDKQTAQDPLQSQEWKRLADDYNTFKNKPVKAAYTLKKPLQEIKRTLLEPSESEQQEMKSIEKKMEQIANHTPEGHLEGLLYTIQKWGGLQKTINKDDIFISLAQQDPKILLALNKNLKEVDLKQLYSLAGRYLLLSSTSQQRSRCLVICQKLTEKVNKAEKQELEKQLSEELLAGRVYDPIQHPLYLVFEHYASLIMRKEQVDKLNDFLSGGTSNPVMEMIMGSGKSKILLPLLGLLRADGKALSMLIVPTPLFESISSDTQQSLNMFSKSLRTLHFDRNSSFTKRSLEEIRDILQEAIVQKECLIMTSKSVQSLLLKLIERADQMYKSETFLSDEMHLMQQVLGLLNRCGNPLIDEADTVLNVLHEVCFSMGEAASPKMTELHLIGEIYHLLYNDPLLKTIARLESDSAPDPAAPPLTESIYYTSLQQPLAEALIERLKKASLGDPSLDQELQSFLTTLTKEKYSQLLHYLTRNKSTINQQRAFFKSLSPALQELFALAGEELSHLLPVTLTRTSDENYGLDGDAFAIPYSAVNTPSHGSFFSNPYITMNYTFQIHFKKEISKETLMQQLTKLQKQALKEMNEQEVTIKDTQAWKFFCQLKGDLELPLFNFNDLQLIALTEHVNSSIAFKKQAFSAVFLPQLKLYENKLACNSFGFAALFKIISGFTGTLWNANSMHRKLNPLPAKGTDAKTLSLLWNMGKNTICRVPKGSPKAMVDEILRQGHAFDLISDAGGYFKEGGNLDISRKLALQLKKPVIFYNARGEQTVTDGKQERPLKETALAEEERLTFLDQSHTTGADVKQRMHATGIVTIGRNMLLRDLLQSAWRLRGLEKGQQVVFVIDSEVDSMIRQALNLDSSAALGFPEILYFVVQNQSKQQGHDNYKAFKAQLWELPQSLLVKVLLSRTLSEKKRKAAFELLREVWIKPSNLSSGVLYGEPAIERPGDKVVKEDEAKCIAFLQNISSQLPFLSKEISSLTAEAAQLVEKTLPIIPPFIISPQADHEETVEIEDEALEETQAEEQLQIHTQSNPEEDKVKLGVLSGSSLNQVEDLQQQFLEEKLSYIPCFPLEKQMMREPVLREFASLFKGIYISMNVLEWKEEEKNLNQLKLLGSHRIPFHHLNVEGDTITLLSQLEAGHNKDPKKYYNLYFGFKDPSMEVSKEIFEKTVKLKFLNGESDYNKKELRFLEQWIRAAGPKKMRQFFFSTILNNQPDKEAAFPQSSISKLFHQLISTPFALDALATFTPPTFKKR